MKMKLTSDGVYSIIRYLVPNDTTRSLQGKNLLSGCRIFSSKVEHSFEIVKPKTAFVLTFILLGFDIVSGLIVITTVTMIIIDTYGMCSLWGVDFNALTLINLIAAIGLSIEFTG